MTQPYSDTDPPREEIDALGGPTLLEFGSNTCGICAAAQPRIAQALAAHPQVRHIKLEDGRTKRLGRTFGVKLWPTLVFLDNGREVARLVRPQQADLVSQALAALQVDAR
jgi:thioredoxin 1